ncbi:PotD/PotF family extracellular solute-binding protein [Aquabacterium sp.]|uniref:ABC transporter substrate-binding protein n=1 Tax=Aquabacterium sp. TaxID=1872578 RepID=UPI0025BE3686|nr:PotD/PotF family extracellular solute-binding protein [Aquabacterium sp.]
MSSRPEDAKLNDAGSASAPVADSLTSGLSRRTVLKGGLLGATGILAAGYGPAIHAADPIVLRYLGTAVNQDKAIGDKFTADTGIKVQYIPVTTDDVTKRAVTAPNSFDLIDTEYFSLKKIVPTGNLKGIDAKRIKHADKITSLFTKGEVAGKKVGDQGTAPKKVMYLEGERSKVFSKAPTQFMSLIPTVYNADTLGIRPDLIKRPISSWAELLNPEFKGKAAILNIPSIGIMDAAMVVEAMGLYKYPDKGNMTKKEIDLTIKTLIEAKKAGQFRSLWKDFNESVNLMASGEVVIQSMWSPAVTAVRTKGISCTFQPLKEGYRAWAAGFGIPATLSGKKLDAAYEFINWFLDGWAGAYLNRQGYYSAVLDTAKAKMEAYEWAYWMEGKPAAQDIKSPTGQVLAKKGEVRDGGSYEARMGGIACWNAIMDENTYMVQKWNEFVAA